MNIIYLIILMLFFISLGDILMRLLRVACSSYSVLTGIGMIFASYIAFLLASFGCLNKNIVSVLTAVVVLISAKRVLGLLNLLCRKIGRVIKELKISNSIFFIILIIQITVNFFLSFTPPTGWDSLAYHLAIPKLIFQEGRMIDPVSYGGVSYPLSIQMLYGICMLFGGGYLAKLLAWAIGILTICAIYELVCQLGCRVIGIIAGAIFYGTQVVSMWTGKCYVDISLAFFTTVAVLALLMFLKEKTMNRWIIFALLIGVLPAIKYNGIFLAFIIGAYAIFKLFFGPNRWKPDRLILAMVIIICVITILNIHWYLRPNTVSKISGDSFKAVTVAAGNNPAAAYVHRLAFAFWQLTLFYDHDGRISPVFLAFIPLFIFIRPKGAVNLLLIISLSYIFLFSFFGFLHSRYILPVLPLLSIVSAYIYYEIIGKQARLKYFLRIVIFFTLIFNIGLTIYNHRPEICFLGKKMNESEYITARVRVLPAINYINKNIRGGGVLFVGESRGYYLDVPYLWGHAIRGMEYDNILEFLKQKNITHILVNERIIYRKKADEEMRSILAFLDDKMINIYQYGDFKIYKIK